MTTGPNSFKVPIQPKDITEIVESSRQLRITDMKFIKSASYEEVHAAYTIMALEEFLKTRRCDPDFQVVLNGE